MNDKLYWILRNGSSFILNLLVLPVFLVMFALEAIWDGLRAVFTADGSEELSYPWQLEWPFFRERDL